MDERRSRRASRGQGPVDLDDTVDTADVGDSDGEGGSGSEGDDHSSGAGEGEEQDVISPVAPRNKSKAGSASPKRSPTKQSRSGTSSSSQHRRERRPRRTEGGDEISVDSKGSGNGGNDSRHKSSRSSNTAGRRTSGATPPTGGGGTSSEKETTSLHSLHSKSRRRSTGGRPDSDDVSRAESVSSSGDSSRRSGARRSGRRRGHEKDEPPSTGSGSGERRPSIGRRKTSNRAVESKDAASVSSSGHKEKGGSSHHEKAPRPGTMSRRRSGSSRSAVEEEAKKDVAASTTSSDGFPAFGGAGDTTGFSTDFAAFSSDTTGFGSGGGGDAFGAAFGDAGASGFPAATTTTPSFGAAFGDAGGGGGAAFASAFGDTASAFSTGDTSSFFPDQQAPSFEAAPVTNWDKSPLTDIPKRPESKLSLFGESNLALRFVGQPVTNPINGNIICCAARPSDGVVYMHELDPRRNYLQVASTPVFTTELQRKLATKYNVAARSLDNVITIATGLHYMHGQTRLRVVAILDLQVVESHHQVMRVVAVWQWGYASPNPIALQYALTPPSGGDFSYDASSLQNADGLMFVAGASPKGPCIFMCKPAVRETWSANFLPGIARITCMAVTPNLARDSPYIAVAFNDRTVSVWTYQAALTAAATKGNEPSKRWLFPLCRLDGMTTLTEQADAMNFNTSETKQQEGDDAVASAVRASILSEDPGFCTNLSWLQPQPSMGTLPLLAASYQNGICIFNVALPVVADKSKGDFRPLPDPTPNTTVNQVPALLPISVKRWLGDHEESYATWLNLGPQTGPCLGLLLHGTQQSNQGAAVVALATLRLSLYRRGPPPKGKPIPIDIIAHASIAPDAGTLFPTGILGVCGRSSMECHSKHALISYSPRRSDLPDTAVLSLRHAVSSIPPGLTSTGDVLLTDTNDDKDGILHVYTVTQLERQKSTANANMQDWSLPRRRMWLCKTLVGDTKATSVVKEESKEQDRGFGMEGDEEVKGGASSDVVCELFDESLDRLIPLRIVRCQGVPLCAVIYRYGLSASKGGGASSASLLGNDGSSIAFCDWSGATPSIQVVEGRDVTFFPVDTNNTQPRGLLLSADGSTLTFFTWDSPSKSVQMHSACRPVVGIDTDVNYIESRRIFAFCGANMVNLAVVGTRLRDNKACLISGDLCSLTEAQDETWSTLLPNVVTGRSLYLNDNELIVNVIGLEGDDSGYRNFAMATSHRVLIVSAGLEISAEHKVRPAADLAPIGSFGVAFLAEHKLRYLCCLDGRFARGCIATLPLPQLGHEPTVLTALRPDRILLSNLHEGTRLVEYGQNPNIFLLPTATTRPALLLEPLVANAICVGGKQSMSTTVLRTVVEKFGRKVASLTHDENEGIGNLGAGMTGQTFEILSKYGLHQAASWLLTGTVPFGRDASSVILPPWLPVAPKAKAALNSDGLLHVLANGDSYLSEYIQAPGQKMASTLPRQSDCTSELAMELARHALTKDGDALSAIKLYDLVGGTASETLILQLALVQKSADVTDILKSLSGYGSSGGFGEGPRIQAPSSLAALAVALKQPRSPNQPVLTPDQVNKWMKPLAPSLQRGAPIRRARQTLLGEDILAKAGHTVPTHADPLWVSPCNESKHVWNEGPQRQKDHLLTLGSLEDWLGRRRPVILGKEGASAAQDRGGTTLADILNMDDDFGTNADDDAGDKDDKSDLGSAKGYDWVDGVGEGRSDEANLSAYFRMSEGEDEDSPWRTEGITDLSPYANKALVIGDSSESVSLQPSTSSCDEGEPGKVKILYDLVFAKPAGDGIASGLAIAATRGGSVDIGVLHRHEKTARQKCSMEFWYWLPSSENVPPGDMVLVRRTMGPSADDLSKVSLAADKDSVLWEILLKPTGVLEFRTCGGSALVSSSADLPAAAAPSGDDDSDEETQERKDLAKFGRWNHVSIVLISKEPDITSCSATLLMKGEQVAEGQVSMAPPGFDTADVDELLQKSHVVFGLNHGAGFRLTEIRIWACERSADDTKYFLYEALTAAETKKKFKVKISNKSKMLGGGMVMKKMGKGAFLAPPKGATGMLAAPKGGLLAPKAGGLAPPARAGVLAPKQQTAAFSLAPKPKVDPNKFSLAPQAKPAAAAAAAAEPAALDSTGFGTADMAAKPAEEAPGFEAFGTFGEQDVAAAAAAPSTEVAPQAAAAITDDEQLQDDEILIEDDMEEEVPVSLWDSAIPLSQQVRSSAAAALIRGPPATRHFGGNRGGLPDFSGMERSGVGGIAICGSEKTIVWRDNEDPPALTYPIGASGAVVSDLMDDEGSEFLCCFLAKEKRMVVFELQSRTVVVELQMTTKLNFWRFLPPEAAENTLCFMLVTPVGGFHWMPLEESPRPHQVWKRGSELQGKKVVNYEEGGSNGLDGPDILSRVGLVMVTKASGGGTLEAWIVPIDGDSKASQVSDDVMGACFCQPPFVEDGPFLPLLVTVHHVEGSIYVNVLSVTAPKKGSVALGEIEVTRVIEDTGLEEIDYEPPPLAMGSFPEAACCSIGNIVVVIIRRKGLIAAFEIEEEDLSLIALESVGHYVIDAVMRYSPEVGGAEIVMLLSDDDNPKDGRMVSFCFRSAA